MAGVEEKEKVQCKKGSVGKVRSGHMSMLGEKERHRTGGMRNKMKVPPLPVFLHGVSREVQKGTGEGGGGCGACVTAVMRRCLAKPHPNE